MSNILVYFVNIYYLVNELFVWNLHARAFRAYEFTRNSVVIPFAGVFRKHIECVHTFVMEWYGWIYDEDEDDYYYYFAGSATNW